MSNEDEDFAAMLAESEKGKPRHAKRPKVGDTIKLDDNLGRSRLGSL